LVHRDRLTIGQRDAQSRNIRLPDIVDAIGVNLLDIATGPLTRHNQRK